MVRKAAARRTVFSSVTASPGRCGSFTGCACGIAPAATLLVAFAVTGNSAATETGGTDIATPCDPATSDSVDAATAAVPATSGVLVAAAAAAVDATSVVVVAAATAAVDATSGVLLACCTGAVAAIEAFAFAAAFYF